MLSWIQVKNFRCFEEARLDLHPETTVLVGQNAQGKTSLLEAACLLMRLQSPRTSVRTDFIRFGAKACVIEGETKDARLRFGQSSTARKLAVNDAVASRSTDYLACTSRVVWMDHADMNLARGGGEHRRRFLDFAAAQLFGAYLPALRSYERALRSRNFLLKRDAAIAWKQVDAYAQLMEKHGKILSGCRDELIVRLSPYVAAIHERLSQGREAAALAYAKGHPGESLTADLEARRAEEERGRGTACGPHRDDVVLEINGRAAGAFASEGQQRTLCLALKLAQARVLEEGRGEPPLLLMDDIFGELDKHRRQALLGCLPAGTQKVMTTTFLDWAEGADPGGLTYEVAGGLTRLKSHS